MTQLWLKMTACELGRGIDNGSISPIGIGKNLSRSHKKSPTK